MKTAKVTMNLPVNLELDVELIADGEDFDVKEVRVMEPHGITVSEVNESLDDDLAYEVMRQLKEA